MLKLYTAILIWLCVVPSVASLECPQYTLEQEAVLRHSFSVGVSYDLGYSLTAIVIQESFVGKYIVRINPKDGKSGSYGLGHVLLSWVMTYEGVTNTWEAKELFPVKLLTDDQYALTMSLNHLMKDQHKGWRTMIRSYNGSEIYVGKISKHVRMLKECYKLEEN